MAGHTHSTQRNLRHTLMQRYIAAWEVTNGKPMPFDDRPNYCGSGWFQLGSRKVRTQELFDYLAGHDISALDQFYSDNHA